jgi:apolipoprotein N-acyltransferase
MAMAVFTPGAPQPLENKVVLVDPQGAIGFEYLKAFPVPGGEANSSVAGTADMPVLDTPYGRIATVICFDMDHYDYVHQAAEKDVDLLFAPANTWAEVAQIHAEMATFRAIENGVTVVRPASNGLSIVADPYGRVLAQSNYWDSDGGAVVANVPMRGTTTIYGQIGDLVALAAAAGLLGLTVWGVLRGWQARRRAATVAAPTA